MNSKEIVEDNSSSKTHTYWASKFNVLIRLLLPTLTLLLIIYSVYFWKQDHSVLNILLAFIQGSGESEGSDEQNSGTVQHQPVKGPRSHFILTIQCMLFILLPMYINMFFALTSSNEEAEAEQSSDEETFSNKNCVQHTTKHLINQMLNQFRVRNAASNSDKKQDAIFSGTKSADRTHLEKRVEDGSRMVTYKFDPHLPTFFGNKSTGLLTETDETVIPHSHL